MLFSYLMLQPWMLSLHQYTISILQAFTLKNYHHSVKAKPNPSAAIFLSSKSHYFIWMNISQNPFFVVVFKSVLTRLAELNCSIMHQYIILYLWCSFSLSLCSAVLKFGAKHELHACKAPCVLIVLYILLICNASWYQVSRAPRPSERFKERREEIPLALSMFHLLLSTFG